MATMQELFVQNVLANVGNTSLAERLIASDLDPMILRPFSEDGKSWITVNVNAGQPGKVPVYETIVCNTPAILRREDWLLIDKDVQMQAKKPLVFANAIFAATPLNIPNAMGKLSVQHTNGTGQADGLVSMDPVRVGERSKPIFDSVSTPLPVTHSDGNFSLREVLVSRNGGLPLDTVGMAEAGQVCGEITEDMFLGNSGVYTFAGGSIWGAQNYPNRITFVITSPEAGGWTGDTLIGQILYAMKLLADDEFPGPYTLFLGREWVPWLNKNYNVNYQGTLRSRILEIDGLSSITIVPRLTGFTMLLFQLTRNVVEGLNGMDFTPVQWQEGGGMELFFKVMGIKVSRFRSDYNGNAGYVHMTAASPTTSTTTTTTTTT